MSTSTLIIKTNPSQNTNVLIKDMGLIVPQSGGQITIVGLKELERAQISDNLLQLTQDDAYGAGSSTLILNDGGGNIAQADVPEFLLNLQTITGNTLFSVCAGQDGRLSDARIPTGPAGGDLRSTYPNPVVHRSSQDFSFTSVITPTQITSTQNDYSPTGLATATVLRLSSDTIRSVTGLAGGASGRVLVIWNAGNFGIRFLKENVGSTAANRFSTTANLTLLPGGSMLIQYDAVSARWRISAQAASGGASGYNVSFGIFQAAQSYVEVQSTNWTAVTEFRWPGSAVATIDAIKMIMSGSAAGGDAAVRIFDLTNSQVIAVANPLAVTGAPLIYDLGGVSNIPAGESLWEVQLMKIATTKPRVHGIDINAVT